MKPIRPTRHLGGSIAVEATPLRVGFSNIYRGVDLGFHFEPIVNGTTRATAASLYRTAPRMAPVPTLRPVIVRERNMRSGDEPWTQSLFEQATLTRSRMSGTPAPQLLYTFGVGAQVLASVEEYLCGATLEEVLRKLRTKSQQMPITIALAIARGLFPLWSVATSAPRLIRFLVDPAAVIIDSIGRVRVLPDYAEERARQTVGAAVALMSAPISYAPPEQILGTRADARGGMFTLGLLLYEMITGAHPVASADTSMFEILSRMARDDVPALSERRSDVHACVAELVHRCLARDPAQRFASWRELHEVLAAVQALFPVSGSAEIADYLRTVLPIPVASQIELDVEPSAWREFSSSGYHAVPLPSAVAEDAGTAPVPRRAPVLDPDACYVGVDARPMFAASDTLLVDARPVTRAELERFFIVTNSPRPTVLDTVSAAFDDEPCTFISTELAEAYARWAGKRLPTDAEWEAAVAALGAARLGTGEVWEWTTTPHTKGGHVVRGGRWRDQAISPARPENRSFETSPVADVGFRCVASRGGA